MNNFVSSRVSAIGFTGTREWKIKLNWKMLSIDSGGRTGS